MCEKNLNLHEILTMLEDEEIQVPPDEEIGVYIQPPINANDDVTDEDSGDEDMTSIHHLPGNQLLAPAEVSQEFELSDNKDEEDPSLSQQPYPLVQRRWT
ncbi:piggyBac transposable element-derived protein 3-like [Homalodisca vitripennis]|uniref:piggyBac transposable element-derived protein 3-like n=1 Tax=Homalodisca vitripennis TaxID=197043 RepID=UPI001EEB5949|nr:piggyBac transposable element-derived protein 3-like [Homalodisca vitripennis]